MHVLDAPRLRPVVVSGDSVGEVLRDGDTVSVREHGTVNATCQVDALPATTSVLTWYRNGSLVYAGQYYAILAVQRRDTGKYQCQTSNTMTPSQGNSQIGVGRAEISLIVMCKKRALTSPVISHRHRHRPTGRDRGHFK